MPSYLQKTSQRFCVTNEEVHALQQLVVLCAFDAAAIAVFAAFNGLLAPSSAAVFCVISFTVSTFLDNFRLPWPSHISAIPCDLFIRFLTNPQLVSISWLPFLLAFRFCPRTLGFTQVVTFGIICIGHILFLTIFCHLICQLRFNKFLRWNLEWIILVLSLVCVLSWTSQPWKWFRSRCVPVLDAHSNNSNVSSWNGTDIGELCRFDSWHSELYLLLFFIGPSYCINTFRNVMLMSLRFNFELHFNFLRNTAEALHLFSKEQVECFRERRLADCHKTLFNFEQIKEEVENYGNGLPLPQCLLEEEELLLKTKPVHLRALCNLEKIAYGMIRLKNNDILEVEEASHSELWWKGRVVERAKTKEDDEEEEKLEEEFLIPSKIKAFSFYLLPTGIGYSQLSPEKSRWERKLDGRFDGKTPWTVDPSHIWFRKTYELVEQRTEFRRRSLVLLGATQLTSSIAEILERRRDPPFIAGFKVPEARKFLCWTWNAESMKKEKEKLYHGIRQAIQSDRIPIITTATAVDEGLRTREMAPLVILVGRKEPPVCQAMFDVELEGTDPESAAEELGGLWEQFHKGPQWVPMKWLELSTADLSTSSSFSQLLL